MIKADQKKYFKILQFVPLHGQALDIIKIIAALLMLLDHANKILWDSEYPFLWLIGRGAFPLFAYVFSCHLARGTNLRPLLVRLVLFGIMSAPLANIAFFFPWHHGNILFTFAFSAAAACFLLTSEKRVFHVACLLALIWSIPTDQIIEYGTAGILLPVILARIWRGEKEFSAYAFLALILFNAAPGSSWIVSLLGIMATFLATGFVLLQNWTVFQKDRRLTGKWFFYVFYPAHLAVLLLFREIS